MKIEQLANTKKKKKGGGGYRTHGVTDLVFIVQEKEPAWPWRKWRGNYEYGWTGW